MEQIEIKGDLVLECLIQLKLTEISRKIREVKDDLKEIEKMLGHDSDYDSYIPAIRRLG
jgi:hypothetical protein